MGESSRVQQRREKGEGGLGGAGRTDFESLAAQQVAHGILKQTLVLMLVF